MQLDHSFTVPATPDDAWKLFLDLRRVAPCMPGALLNMLDGDRFTGRIKVKIGAVQMSYRGEGTVTRDEPGRTLVLDLSGSEARGAGTAAARVVAAVTADPADPAGTRVRVLTELDITGRPAQFGRGIMAEVGDRIVRQFASGLEELLRSPADAYTGSGTPRSGIPAAAEPEAADLGAAVLPVLLRKTAVPAAAVIVAVLLVRALRRRSR
ncbi:SRPBCC family protein [Streptomyces sp. NBC_00390]|uniref:SRPBCC family protein n=1 Tax=Streptomyces sp. NBC_00390 TaxID=2975736 RepID=UPI002E1A8D10